MLTTEITIVDRTFQIGKPRIDLYIKLLAFAARLYAQGNMEAVKSMGTLAAAMGGTNAVNTGVSIATALQHLEAHDIEELSVILLQMEGNAEDYVFVKATWELGWFMRAVIANVKHIGIQEILKNFGELQAEINTELSETPEAA